MSIDDKVLFLKLLLSQTSKELKKFLYNDDFYLLEYVFPLFNLKTHDISVGCLDEKTDKVSDIWISCEGNDYLKKSGCMTHYVSALMKYWKSSQDTSIGNVLCSIVDAMEHEILHGKSVVIKFNKFMPYPGIILWHAGISIEQIMIELDMRSDR